MKKTTDLIFMLHLIQNHAYANDVVVLIMSIKITRKLKGAFKDSLIMTNHSKNS